MNPRCADRGRSVGAAVITGLCHVIEWPASAGAPAGHYIRHLCRPSYRKLDAPRVGYGQQRQANSQAARTGAG